MSLLLDSFKRVFFGGNSFKLAVCKATGGEPLSVGSREDGALDELDVLSVHGHPSAVCTNTASTRHIHVIPRERVPGREMLLLNTRENTFEACISMHMDGTDCRIIWTGEPKWISPQTHD